jgi:hypothetical protein
VYYRCPLPSLGWLNSSNGLAFDRGVANWLALKR